MPRIRPNPKKYLTNSFQPARTTVVMLTHNPAEGGYFEDRPVATKLSIASLVAHTEVEYDLMVFDNGSSPEMVEYLVDLKENGVIQYLYLSERNIGYGAALNAAFNAAPGEVIAYADDDIFFYPGWLRKRLEILDTFPSVGMVSGQLIEGDSVHDAVALGAEKHGYAIEDFDIPREWSERWCAGLGLDVDVFLSRPELNSIKNYKVELNGVKAFAGATGYSYLFTKEFLQEMPRLTEDRQVGGADYDWHHAANDLGRLRLTTSELTTDHIGNVVDEYWINEAKRFGIAVGDDALNTARKKQKTGNWLIRRSKAQRTIRWIISRLTRLVY
jgi:glycosyltransferase involved in cell wall biosynthesis